MPRTRKSHCWFLVLACSALAQAQVLGDVVTDIITSSPYLWLGEDGLVNSTVISYTKPGLGGAGLWVSVSPLPNTPGAISVEPLSYLVANPFAWYVAAGGEVFDKSFAEATKPFAANWGILTPFVVVADQPFYLASWAGSEFDHAVNEPVFNPGDAYAWGEFVVGVVDGEAELSLRRSAMAEGGIYVGQAVAIPEPSVSSSALAGMMMGLASLRLRRKHVRSRCLSVSA
jgi:hypothetical protein